MRIIVAPDSYKGSLSAKRAAEIMARAVTDVFAAIPIEMPVADGGEGTLEAILAGGKGRYLEAEVTSPLGKRIPAQWGMLEDGTAVIEMAQASGLTLAPEKDPMRASSYGTGELMAAALAAGAKRILMGIGGSATNDGGIGMLQALGFGFFGADGKPVSPDGAGLCALARISADDALPALRDCTFRVACDVTNPLCGPNGCSAVFGPQKGADSAMIAALDGALARYAAQMRTVFPDVDPDLPGSGAAGGMGFALRAALRAELTPGAELVLDAIRMNDALRGADVLVTGEGRLDAQTAMGKAPFAAACRAQALGVPVIALSGCIGRGAAACNAAGIDAYFPILQRVCTEAEALDPAVAAQNLTDTAEQVFRLWRTVSHQAKGSE